MRKTIFNILYYLGVGHVLHFVNTFNRKIPILLFHRISTYPDFVWPTIDPQEFDNLITFLKKKYVFISINEIFENPSKNSCAIVFDDGFIDFKIHALPILKKHKVPTTLFIPTKCFEENEIIWTSTLDSIFRNNENKEITFSTSDGQQHNFEINNPQSRFKAALDVQRILKNIPNSDRLIIVKELINKYPSDIGTEIESMSINDLQLLQNINLESHSYSHPFFPSLTKEELTQELSKPITFSEQYLHKKFKYISFPMGGYNNSILEETDKYYSAGFAVDNRLVDLNKIDQSNYNFKIPRINVTGSNPYELFLRINGFHKLFGR